jgi:hypothetical protein
LGVTGRCVGNARFLRQLRGSARHQRLQRLGAFALHRLGVLRRCIAAGTVPQGFPSGGLRQDAHHNEVVALLTDAYLRARPESQAQAQRVRRPEGIVRLAEDRLMESRGEPIALAASMI